jgi:integral membrane sensor domain MASE1
VLGFKVQRRTYFRFPLKRSAMRKAGAAEARIPARHGVLSAATYSLELVIIAASYLGLAAMWLSAPSINLAATPLWPPSGLALALVLVRGFRIWPAILVGLFSFQLMQGRPVLESASIGIGSLLAGLTGAWMIGRWSNGRKTFETPAGIAKFALISFVPTAMINSIAALGAVILGDNDGLAARR